MTEANAQQASQPVKYTITHYRQPKHTHEAFIKWIIEEHLPLAIPLFKKHAVISYSLFVTPAPLNEVMKQAVGKVQPTWDFADFDCVIEYKLPGMETVGNVMSDPEWTEVLKDQDEWVDTSRALVTVGYETPYLLETGEVVNMPK
ncbi:hypothetical protein N431DRAFT_539545 [Stipitochalara longipes BDJ]|nr:hypothetical protein N431DRAFT_539545 [Stipitochalara longipes BDJ]